MHKPFRLATAVILVLGISATSATAQVPKPPTPPEQVQPIVDVVSPISFQLCLAPSVAVALIQTAAALTPVGLPVPANTLNPVFKTPLDVTCTFFTPKVVPPTCDVDTTVFGTLPANAVTVPQPASILATEVYAIEAALAYYGAPTGDELSPSVYEQLGCRD